MIESQQGKEWGVLVLNTTSLSNPGTIFVQTTQVNADTNTTTTSTTKDKKKHGYITTKYAEINISSDVQFFQVMEHSVKFSKEWL